MVNTTAHGNPITMMDAIDIKNRLEHIKKRIEPILATTLFPYTEEESNYLNSVRKRILENHELNIQVMSKSQESFWYRITKKEQSFDDGILGEDGSYYEEALLWAIEDCLPIIMKTL